MILPAKVLLQIESATMIGPCWNWVRETGKPLRFQQGAAAKATRNIEKRSAVDIAPELALSKGVYCWAPVC